MSPIKAPVGYAAINSGQQNQSFFDRIIALFNTSNFVDGAEMLAYQDEISRASSNAIFEILNYIVHLEEVGKVSPEKANLWNCIERFLTPNHRAELVELIFNECEFNDLPFYIALIQDEEMQNEFAIRFLNHPDLIQNSIPFLNCYVECFVQLPYTSKFISAVLAQDLLNNSHWFLEAIHNLFHLYTPKTAALIFISLDDDQRNLVWKEPEHIQKMIPILFALEERPEFRRNFLFICTRHINKEILLNWLDVLANENPVVAPYLHFVFNEGEYLYIATNPALRGHINTYVLHSWNGTSEEKKYLVQEMMLGTFPIILLTVYHFSYVNNQGNDWISLHKLNENLVVYENEGLEKIEAIIKSIPPLIVALGMHCPLYQPLLIKLCRYFTEEQQEACGFFLPAENIIDILLEYETTLMPSDFAQLLSKVSHDISPYLEDNFKKLSIAYGAAYSNYIEWLDAADSAMKSISQDKLNQSLVIGIGLKSEFGRIFNSPLGQFFRNYRKDHPKYGIINQAYGNIDELNNSIESKLMELRDCMNKNFSCHEEVEYEEFAEGYLCRLTPVTQELLGLTENVDEMLANFGIRSNADFERIGLSIAHLNAIDELRRLIDQLNPEISLINHWRDLLYSESITNEQTAQKRLDLFCHALENRFPIDKLEEVVNFIRSHFHEESALLQPTIRDCISFVRTHQFDYILYHHFKNSR